MRADSTFGAVSSVAGTRVIGRYVMYDEIASGGMASVHFGRLLGAVGFSRTVAIKHLHSHYLADVEFVSMFVDEARLSSRIQHPNVASPLDVVLEDTGEIFLVMDYIHGETLVRLIGNARAANLVLHHTVSAAIIGAVLRGLHAAHEAVDERGAPLGIVHRDVSPQNIIVGADGVTRVLDFGVAKAVSRSQSTRQGHLKGKLSYMAPEQMQCGPIDRRVDTFAAGVVLWEALTQRRLFKPENPAAAFSMVMHMPIERPSCLNPAVPPELDAVTMKALARDPDAWFQSAREFADAIEAATPLASYSRVGEWVQRLCGERLAKRAERVAELERATLDLKPVLDSQELARLVTPRPIPVPAKLAAEASGLLKAEVSTVSRGGGELISPSAETPAPSSVRRFWPLVAGISALSVLIGLGSFQLSRRGSIAPERHTTVPSPAPARAAPPQAEPASPPEPAAVPTAVEALPVAEPSADVSPERPPQAARHAVSSSRHLRKSKPLSANASKVGKKSNEESCDPPYTIDARGIRRVKSHCL
jgi:serine/threonine protein kinase